MESILIEIDKFTFKQIGILLFEMIPEYRSRIEDIGSYECLGNYSFLNDFAIALCKEIETSKENDYIKKSFSFINALSETKNLEVINLLKVGILEILFTSGNPVREYSSTLLSESAKIYFMSFKELYI